MAFVLLYWKQIAAGIIVMALLGFGFYMRGVIADRDELKLQVKQVNTKLVEVSKLNEALSHAVDAKTNELQSYIDLNNKLSNDKSNIQVKYVDFVKKVYNEKPKTVPGVGITEPYVLIGAGMPIYANYSTGSYHP